MRLGLDDNSRDALHFVLLGSGVMLLLRLIVAGIGLMIEAPPESDLAASIATFRNGYLLGDPEILVSGGMELPGRLATAAILCIVAGIVAAILCVLIARLTRSDARKAALIGARAGSILALVWGLYAALFLPPQSVRVDEEAITVIERRSVLDAISWPWPGTERRIAWDAITSIEHRTDTRSAPCFTKEKVLMVLEQGDQVITTLTPQGADCTTAQHEAMDQSAHLAVLLNSYRLR